jgi:hypothetical protein
VPSLAWPTTIRNCSAEDTTSPGDVLRRCNVTFPRKNRQGREIARLGRPRPCLSSVRYWLVTLKAEPKTAQGDERDTTTWKHHATER